MRAGWGSDTQTPAETEKGRGRETGAESRGDWRLGQRKQEGAKSPGQRSRLKRGPSAQETLSRETTETDVGAERGTESKGGDPDPEKLEGEGRVRRSGREHGEQQQRTAGCWGAFRGPRERDPKESRRSQCIWGAQKEGKS